MTAAPGPAGTGADMPKTSAMPPAPAMTMGGHPAQQKGVGPRDPVCGHEVEEAQAKAAGLTSEFNGIIYYFCSYACNKQFEKDPERYQGQRPATPSAAMPPATVAGPAAPMPHSPAPTPPDGPAAP